MRTDDADLRAEAYRLVQPVLTSVRARHGHVPGAGSTAWWAAPDDAKLAGLLILAEAYLVLDDALERTVAERLKAATADIAAAHDWTAASRRPSHAELVRRRTQPGPGARPVDSFDAAAAARWVATGSSAGAAVVA